MKKTILLVSANRHHIPYPVYPIGVSYLRGYLESNLADFHVEVFDCNLHTNEELAQVLQQLDPAYVGVSLRNIDGANSLDRSSFIGSYRDIVSCIRTNSAATVFIGGAGFSIYPQALIDALKPDYGIIGEGEESLCELVRALEQGEDPSTIEGVACYVDGTFRCNPHTKYLKSLDVKFEHNLIDFYWQSSGMLNIQTKRGCPYSCIYCSYPLIDGRKVRTLDTDLIVDNIKRVKAEKGIDYLFFTDSVFNIYNSYNIELAEKIIKSGLKIRWGAYFSPSNLSDEMLALFRASGLTHIEFGTESFSDSQLVNYGKHFTFREVLEASELCLKHNVYYAHFLILGGYGETQQTLKETIENSKRIRYSVFFPYMGMRVYPGTKLQAIAIEKGLISPNDDLLAPTYYLEDGFEVEEVKRMALETGKAWVFPDDPQSDMMDVLRYKRNKKGLLWEYLRRP